MVLESGLGYVRAKVRGKAGGAGEISALCSLPSISLVPTWPQTGESHSTGKMSLTQIMSYDEYSGDEK